MPLRITCLSIEGFKSFAGKVSIEVGPGLSCVVGVNGSGKSNVLDAFCFALTLDAGNRGIAGRALLRCRVLAELVHPSCNDASTTITFSDGEHSVITAVRCVSNSSTIEFTEEGRTRRISLSVYRSFLSKGGINVEVPESFVALQLRTQALVVLSPGKLLGYLEGVCGASSARSKAEEIAERIAVLSVQRKEAAGEAANLHHFVLATQKLLAKKGRALRLKKKRDAAYDLLIANTACFLETKLSTLEASLAHNRESLEKKCSQRRDLSERIELLQERLRLAKAEGTILRANAAKAQYTKRQFFATSARVKAELRQYVSKVLALGEHRAVVVAKLAALQATPTDPHPLRERLLLLRNGVRELAESAVSTEKGEGEGEEVLICPEGATLLLPLRSLPIVVQTPLLTLLWTAATEGVWFLAPQGGGRGGGGVAKPQAGATLSTAPPEGGVFIRRHGAVPFADVSRQMAALQGLEAGACFLSEVVERVNANVKGFSVVVGGDAVLPLMGNPFEEGIEGFERAVSAVGGTTETLPTLLTPEVLYHEGEYRFHPSELITTKKPSVCVRTICPNEETKRTLKPLLDSLGIKGGNIEEELSERIAQCTQDIENQGERVVRVKAQQTHFVALKERLLVEARSQYLLARSDAASLSIDPSDPTLETIQDVCTAIKTLQTKTTTQCHLQESTLRAQLTATRTSGRTHETTITNISEQLSAQRCTIQEVTLQEAALNDEQRALTTQQKQLLKKHAILRQSAHTTPTTTAPSYAALQQEKTLIERESSLLETMVAEIDEEVPLVRDGVERHAAAVLLERGLAEELEVLEGKKEELDRVRTGLIAECVEEANTVMNGLGPRLGTPATQCRLCYAPALLLEGVNVMARLPTSSAFVPATQLSGGQCALVSTQLLLALSTIKAPPIFLFDELDAPLDRAHTEGLAKVLSQLNTPTLCISLRQEMMAAATQIIGVYQNKGISTIVQKRFS